MSDKITVLYVDDEPINLMIFNLNFKNRYNVVTALSGSEGLAKLEQHPETIILISDMRMPGMNGLEFIRKAKENYPSIVCFILTGFDITKEIAEALESNLINKYFSKPFNVKEIEKSISESIC
jgi:response regulator RpfG family c-di-GMP phosphodiesterase